MQRKRVVVTGLGLITCLGGNVDATWSKLLNGCTGIQRLASGDYEKLPCRIAGLVPEDELQKRRTEVLTKSDLKTMSRGTMFAVLAADEAFKHAKWKPTSLLEQESSGTIIGLGMDGIEEIIASDRAMLRRGYAGMGPFALTRSLANMASGHVSMRFGLAGPCLSINTACATGLHCIGDAFRTIQHGEASVMLAGGAEATVNPWSVAAFCRIRALATQFNDSPEQASRPFDAARDGFVMSEGAGVLLLESLDHASQRGASVFAEVLGFGRSGDAHSLTAPEPSGSGAYRAMAVAVQDAGIQPDQLGYINAHATSTQLGDSIENSAIRRLLDSGHADPAVPVSSIKGHVGHLLGGAGAVEAVCTIKAIQEGRLPTNRNLITPDNPGKLNLLSGSQGNLEWIEAGGRKRIALTNSFGFGGTNACMVFSEWRTK